MGFAANFFRRWRQIGRADQSIFRPVCEIKTCHIPNISNLAGAVATRVGVGKQLFSFLECGREIEAEAGKQAHVIRIAAMGLCKGTQVFA
ncbi:hypothetical protein D9M69_609400 [compost metagenome]